MDSAVGVFLGGLVRNSDFGFRFLGGAEFVIPLPSSEFHKVASENSSKICGGKVINL
jgi:hypothetical protein